MSEGSAVVDSASESAENARLRSATQAVHGRSHQCEWQFGILSILYPQKNRIANPQMFVKSSEEKLPIRSRPLRAPSTRDRYAWFDLTRETPPRLFLGRVAVRLIHLIH